MSIKVKSAAESAEKWAEVTPGRSTYYASETPAAAGAWETNTIAAAANYKAGVSAANIEKMFAGGVKRVGASKFSRKVTDVGVDRFGPGVRAAQTDYASGVSPMLDEISRLSLPARKVRGDPGNIARVTVITEALHKKRLALRAAGA